MTRFTYSQRDDRVLWRESLRATTVVSTWWRNSDLVLVYSMFVSFVNMVSVILPYYNGKQYIGEAVDSVLCQSYRDFELLLIDDGSSFADGDYLKELVSEKADDRIRLFRKTNGGLSDARNFGINNSSGDLIAFLDQDDVWHRDKLADQVRVLQNRSDVSFTVTDGTVFGENNRDYGVAKRLGMSEGVVKDSYAQMLRSNFVIASSTLFRRSAVELVGYSNKNYVAAPDYEYFVRFAARMDFYFIEKQLVYYRLHAANTVKLEMRLFLEGISILMDCRLTGWRQVAVASRQFVKLYIRILKLWLSKIANYRRSNGVNERCV